MSDLDELRAAALRLHEMAERDSAAVGRIHHPNTWGEVARWIELWQEGSSSRVDPLTNKEAPNA